MPISPVLPALGDLGSKAASLLSFRSRAVVATGVARRSAHGLTVMYVGNKTNLSFLLRVIFEEHRILDDSGSCNIWNAAGMADARGKRCDMIVFDVPWPYGLRFCDDQRVVEVPSWIRQGLDLGSEWDDIAGRLHASARGEQMRKIRKNGLSAVATSDTSSVVRFYDTMYVPHARRRFGPAAAVDSRAAVIDAVKHGTLLQIVRAGEVIAACVLLKRDGTLTLLHTGFAADDLRKLDGASAAIYYHSLRYAFENGFRKIDYCGSRPLLDDGVYETKRRWGAAVYDDWSLESLLFRFDRPGQGVEAFLCANPLLTRQEGGLVGKVLYREAALTEDDVHKASKRFASTGMAAIHLYSLAGVADDAVHAVERGPIPMKIRDLSNASDPLRVYCDS